VISFAFATSGLPVMVSTVQPFPVRSP
jgi:hypothetical protein